MIAFALAGLLLAAGTPQTTVADEPEGDPLAPARAGMIQCYGPDSVAHTCLATVAYHHRQGDAWLSVATVAADPALPLTAVITLPVVLRGDTVCSTPSREAVLAATLNLLDKPVPGDTALPVLVRLADSMAGTIGREICTRYEPAAGGLFARATIAGVTTPIPPQRVIWVRADAGYHVKPPAAGAG